ncbi:MAG: hypothetical protein PHC75_06105 [Burkholderiales bacterium]|nr:hypothetical protein [Burkholderiales bacterium]
MLLLYRKLNIYTRLTSIIENRINNDGYSMAKFNQLNFNICPCILLGMSKRCQAAFSRRVLVKLLSLDKNVLLNASYRRFIINNFNPKEQSIILEQSDRVNASIMKYLIADSLEDMLYRLLDIYFFRNNDALCAILWGKVLAKNKSFCQFIPIVEKELIDSIFSESLDEFFPSLSTH